MRLKSTSLKTLKKKNKLEILENLLLKKCFNKLKKTDNFFEQKKKKFKKL